MTSSFDTWQPGDEPGIGADNRTQNLMITQFREIFEEEFIEANGNTDIATEQALRILKRNWGVSSVSGSAQLMQFPPEGKYPPLDGSHDYLRDDAMQMAREFLGEGVEVENITLAPVFDGQRRNLTAEDWRAGRRPRYQVLVDTKVDGIPVSEMVPGTWAITDEQIRSTAEARRAQIREGLEANESMGIRDFMMQGEEVPEPVVPRGLANPGRTGRYGNYSVPLPAPPPSNFTDPATLLPGVGNVGPVGSFLVPNSREGIAARVSERGRALRRR
ncbi:hypothetical protein [Antarcticirhabdus aurantiaca]|uniref:Uncharacterized protein n=1 Tax=Antarcticirhabdus aurantiaca TaxID=2606717 RepID=A0ACD4NMM7_9HYPH|nr:hypothetical protein [Antarcticirhabdus aurantiaca]WAJ28033.1 hypothetical protein OXU80_24935 [Jeongeuplla avenae]